MIVTHRVTKQAARYTDAGGREKCAECRFFAPQGWCGKVLGPVSAAGWCKYYSREAVQRWSHPGVAGAGLSGLPPGVSLDLNFMSAGALDPRITFTRASTATYTDSTGTIQTAATNAPRWDYDPVTHALRGLLIEEARTNLLLWSQDVSQVVWQKQGAVVVSNTVAAPNGTNTAQTISVAPNGAGPAFYQIVPGTTATRYEPSFWINPISTTGTLKVGNAVNGANGDWSVNMALLSVGWQRITRNHPAVTIAIEFTGVSNQIGMFIYTTGATINASWWGWQMEAGTFPTSYIGTTTVAVARAQDNCGIAPANTGWFVSPLGSWFAEAVLFGNASNNNGRIVAVIPGNSAPLYALPALTLGEFDGVGAINTVNVMTANAITKAASSWVVGRSTLCLNAGAIVSSAALTQGYAAVTTSGVSFMGSTTSAEVLSGYLRRVSYWPRALTDAEMQQVTT
jgi:hypothetical protein